MSPLQIALVALRALLRNKLRSFLTALGVIIGVGCVIAMTSIGAGARARVQETFASLGSNMLVIRNGSHQAGGVRSGAGTDLSLTWEDLGSIRDEVPGVRLATAVIGTPAQVLAEGQNWATSVQGTTPDFFDIRSWAAARGRVLSEQDVETGAKTAVLGETVAENLFGAWSDPIGQIVRINRVPFEVVGVLEDKGQSPFGSDNDDVVYVPLTTFRSRIQGGLQKYIDGNLLVSATERDATNQVQARIEKLLRARHRIRPGQPDDFSVRNLGDLAEAQLEGAQTMNSLLAAIALVSLVVGGIGIMNIMLVSVTERTREIGLRMAVGAKPQAILTQFLVESIALSLIGGVLGIAAGFGTASWLVARFGWPILVEPGIVAISLATSGGVGVAFGLYPALKASRLDPVNALRYE